MRAWLVLLMAAPAKGGVLTTGSANFAIGADGGVYGWGTNDPDPDWRQYPGNVSVADPVRVPGIEEAVDVYNGGYNGCALTARRDLYCWGINRYGELGEVGNVGTAKLLASNVVDYAVIDNAICITDVETRAFCRGTNNGDRFRAEPQEVTADWVQVGAGTAWVSVAIVNDAVCLVSTSGRMECMGAPDAVSSTAGRALDDVSRVYCAVNHCCAVSASKESLTCFGYNRNYQLGVADQDAELHLNEFGKPIRHLSMKTGGTLVLFEDGSVQASGVLEDLVHGPDGFENVFKPVINIPASASEVESSVSHLCYVDNAAAQVVCRGDNYDYRLGRTSDYQGYTSVFEPVLSTNMGPVLARASAPPTTPAPTRVDTSRPTSVTAAPTPPPRLGGPSVEEAAPAAAIAAAALGAVALAGGVGWVVYKGAR